MARARERLVGIMPGRVSRSGVLSEVKPEPTVTVRMKETQPLEPRLLWLPHGCVVAVAARVLILATSF